MKDVKILFLMRSFQLYSIKLPEDSITFKRNTVNIRLTIDICGEYIFSAQVQRVRLLVTQ